MRYGEQFSLQWKDVDTQRRRITIHFPKSGKDREEVVLNSGSLDALNRLKEQNPARTPDDLVCARHTEWDHRQWWPAVLRKAKITGFRWHDLRHTFASRLAMRDVNLLKIQQLMRHETINMTLRYAHLAPSDLDAAAENVVW